MNSSQKNWKAIKAEAAKWALRKPELSESERAEFEAWLSADSRHERAYAAAEATCEDLSALAHIADVREGLAVPSRREKVIASLSVFPPAHWLAVHPARWISSGVVVAASLLLALNVSFRSTTYVTQAAELRAVTLSDGSVVALGANSRLETDFTRAERRAILARGDAFFSVSKDAKRPFIVTAGDAVVRVVGTKFNIHRDVEEVRVAVVEGVVQVAVSQNVAGNAPFPSDAQVLNAGQQITAARHGAREEVRFSKLQESDTPQPTRLEYQGAKLRDVVADANRYYPPGIELTSSELGDLQVTTAFRTTEVEKVMERLKIILPVDVSRDPDGKIMIRPRN